MTKPNTIDSFTTMLSNEAARPIAFRDKLASIEGTTNATLERFAAQPLDTDIDAVLTAQSVKLAVAATLESFDRIRIESRQKTLADAAAVNLHDIGKGLLEHGLAERTKGRAAKHAGIGKEAAAHQTALMNPDLSPDEWGALENLRAGLVGQAESLEVNLSNAKSAIERFSNVPSAETWHDAVRAVRNVNFS